MHKKKKYLHQSFLSTLMDKKKKYLHQQFLSTAFKSLNHNCHIMQLLFKFLLVLMPKTLT